MQFSLTLRVMRVWVCYTGQTLEREETVSATTYVVKKVMGYVQWDKI